MVFVVFKDNQREMLRNEMQQVRTAGFEAPCAAANIVASRRETG